MDQLTLNIARQQLHTQVHHLDLNIATLCQWINSPKLESGSILVKGRTDNFKTFHDIVTFNHLLPIPVDHIKKFAEAVAQDLIAKRNMILIEIENLEKHPILKQEEGSHE